MTKENRLFSAFIFALIVTSFGFIVRAILLNTLGVEFDLSESQKGALQGAGLFPFALSIIFFSLIIDRVGYGRAMAFAWVLHIASAIITITAKSYMALYVGTFLFSLANGTIEAVVNPATVTLYPKNKTSHLIMLHSGWAAGLVVGGLMAIALSGLGWRWKIGLFIVPTVIYGLMMLGQKFPVQERVAADVSYSDMLKEFGWAGCLIVSIFATYAANEVFLVFGAGFLPAEHSLWVAFAVALVPTLFFGFKYGSFGRPVFVFLLLIMVLSATTEMGTDSWISDLLTPILRNVGANAGNWVLVYISAIMFGLRFFAGPLARRLTPLGLLMICSVLGAAGLFWLANAGTVPTIIVLAATLYAVGKTFYWPSMLGLVSEQFPRGGALTLNAIAGMGMISVGVLGGPFLGTLQDASLDQGLKKANPAIYSVVAQAPQHKFGIEFRPLDKVKIESLSAPEKSEIQGIFNRNSQAVLAKIAILPTIMFPCYLILALYYKKKGGYKAVSLTPGSELGPS
jgi:MFS family permease